MVTAQTQFNLRNARSYFSEHLSVGDYYDEGRQVAGEWFGRGAEQLNLSGSVGAEHFLRLCENQHPGTGEALTPRLNTTRAKDGRAIANRRIFHDFTFSPPKSVSLAALLGADGRIVGAHARAVRSALHEFEVFAATRVRMGAADRNRATGNVVAALFTHETSRALDPHLHTHAIVFNATRDPVEVRWKALQNCDLLQARKFAENAYYHELARELRSFGYGIRNRARGDFEIEGVPDELCGRFSKRHAQIDRALAELIRRKPELAGGNLGELRSRIATAERARKQRDLSPAELRRLWETQTTPGERASLTRLAHSPAASPALPSMREAVEWAEEHLFDRHSVVPEHRIWQEALGRARGAEFSIPDLKAFTEARGYLRNPGQPGDVTRAEVLERERRIVGIARDGAGAFHPLVREPGTLDPRLDPEQRVALSALLRSTHGVTVFRGGAGTGKSFVLRELTRQVQATGRAVVVLAPQRQQVVEMARDGFPAPATLAHCLLRRELPEHALVVVDEAGQIGGRQMVELLTLAARHHARVLLSGDTRQHGPVEASDALRAIERHGGVPPVELHRIRRQDPALARDREEARRIRLYRSAVEAAARGDLSRSFQRLTELGAIVTCPVGEQPTRLAEEYVRLTRAGASLVVVSQTWSEVHRLNERIREALRSAGLLGTRDTVVLALERVDLTTAQKRDERFYPADAVILFNRRVRDVLPGATGRLSGVLRDAVLVEVGGRLIRVRNQFLDHLSVGCPREVRLAEGERLHLKANRRLATGATVTNGELVTVRSVRADRTIELTDGRMLDPGFREFLPGYAVTSYGSQGRTVDHVLLSDSAVRPATNARQWYVSISRGRKGIRLFTPDTEQLREHIVRSGHRPLALDLAPGSLRRSSEPVLWRRLRSRLARFGRLAVERLRQSRFLRPKSRTTASRHEHPNTRGLGV